MLRPHRVSVDSEAIVHPSGNPCSRSHSVGVSRRTRTDGTVSVVIRATIRSGSERPVRSGSGTSSSASSHSCSVSPQSREVVPLGVVEDPLSSGVASGGDERVGCAVCPRWEPLVGSGVEPAERDDGSGSPVDDELLADVASGADREDRVRGPVPLDLRLEVSVPLDDDRLGLDDVLVVSSDAGADGERGAVVSGVVSGVEPDPLDHDGSGSLGDVLVLGREEGVGRSVVAGEEGSSSGGELGDDRLVEDVLSVARGERERIPVGADDGV
jgi:hypothetical protein